MHLDGLDRDEQRLRDLLVAHLLGGELRHPPLARRERLGTGLKHLARTRAGRRELLVPALRERRRTAAMGQLDTLAEVLARLRAVVGAPKHRAEIDQRLRVLERGVGQASTSTASRSHRSRAAPPRRGQRIAARSRSLGGSPHRRASSSSSTASLRASSTVPSASSAAAASSATACTPDSRDRACSPFARWRGSRRAPAQAGAARAAACRGRRGRT